MKKLCPYFLLFLFLNLSAASAQYTWKQRANFGGSGRYTSFGFSIGNYGYIGAGYSGINCNDFWQYDPSTNSWTQKSNVPTGIYAASTFVINTKAYLTGGITGGFSFNTTLWMYDQTANNWTTKATFPGTPRYGAVAFSIGTKGYFGTGDAGSVNGPYLNDFYEYNSLTDSWSVKASFPGLIRFGSCGIALNGMGYLGLGGDDGIYIHYNDWWQYDPATDAWASKTSFPAVGLGYTGAFVINNKIYIGTGNDGTNTALKSFYEYDPVGDAWTPKANYGGGDRWAVASFSIGNIGYFGTGYASSVYYNDFWEYSPPPLVASFQSSDSSICEYTCINFADQSANATSWKWSFPGAVPSSSTAQNPNSICYFVAGNYNVTLVASNGNGSDTLKMFNYITVAPTPPIPNITLSHDTLFCSPDPSYASYQWFYGITPIPGATDTFLVISFNGNYNVSVKNQTGCGIAVGINIAIGLDELNQNPYFTYYPNPVTHELTISMLKVFHKAAIEVTDLLGKKLIEKTFSSLKDNKLVLDFENLPEGTYFVSVNADGEKVTKRVIKH